LFQKALCLQKYPYSFTTASSECNINKSILDRLLSTINNIQLTVIINELCDIKQCRDQTVRDRDMMLDGVDAFDVFFNTSTFLLESCSSIRYKQY